MYHTCVCICTYKRPALLGSLLAKLERQDTDNLFDYSIVVVDNDVQESARKTVESHANQSHIVVKYAVEPEQNIALARNKAVESARGEYIAFIDDDELPEQRWLLSLYKAMHECRAGGVLGPVKRHFEVNPPSWIIKGKLFEKMLFPTGAIIPHCKYTRTGNVLLDRRLFADKANFFDPRLGRSGGEDLDFFRRMMSKGHVFVWCNEAVVSEIVPKERLKRSYFVQRALLNGAVTARNLSLLSIPTMKSLLGLIVYTPALPVLLLVRHDLFMKYLIKECNHIGRILALCGVTAVKERTW